MISQDMKKSQINKKNCRRPNGKQLRKRTLQLRKAINRMDFLVSGTLHVRKKTCGKPTCRCADNPEARHGPYYEWTRRQDGRLVHKIITPKQAQYVVRAIENNRKVRELLAVWEQETVKEILSQ